MADWKRQRTTSYGPTSEGKRGRYSLDSLPPADHVSYNQEQVGNQYGWVKIISPERRYSKGWSQCYVLTECTGCGSVQWTYLANLMQGKTKGCQRCSQRRAVPRWLDRRFTAAKQRCENPKDTHFKDYGGRGIRFEFPSVTEACIYMIETNGLPGRELEIDRIDNDGNYARGNLRWATRSEQNANKRRRSTS